MAVHEVVKVYHGCEMGQPVVTLLRGAESAHATWHPENERSSRKEMWIGGRLMMSPVDDGAAHVVNGEVCGGADVSICKGLEDDCGVRPTEPASTRKRALQADVRSILDRERYTCRSEEDGWVEGTRDGVGWYGTLIPLRLPCSTGPQSQELPPCAMCRRESVLIRPTSLHWGGAPLRQNSERDPA